MLVGRFPGCRLLVLWGLVTVEIYREGARGGHHVEFLRAIRQRGFQIREFRLIIFHILPKHRDVLLHLRRFEGVLHHLGAQHQRADPAQHQKQDRNGGVQPWARAATRPRDDVASHMGAMPRLLGVVLSGLHHMQVWALERRIRLPARR